MILSKKYKFVFLKGRKVGGTSLEIALSQVCGDDDIVTPITPIDELKRIAVGGHPRNYSDNPAKDKAYVELLRRTPPSEFGKIKVAKGKYRNHMPLTLVRELYGDIPSDYLFFCAERSPYSKVMSLANMQAGSFESYKTGGTMVAEE